MTNDGLFFVGQKAFIRKGDEVLTLGDPKEGLDLPGGRIHSEETDLSEALRREVREETGLEIEVGRPFITWLNEFPAYHPQAGKKVFLVGYECEYVSGEVKLSDEHAGFDWVSKERFAEIDQGTGWSKMLREYFGRNQ